MIGSPKQANSEPHPFLLFEEGIDKDVCVPFKVSNGLLGP